MTALIAKINPKQSVAVAILELRAEPRIKSITGGLTVTDDLKIDVKLDTINADAATAISDLIKEQLSIAKDIVGLLVLNQKEFAPAIDILNGVKLEAKDASLGIKSDIKGETLEKLMRAANDLINKGGIK